MKLKYLIWFLVFIGTCAYADSQGSTFDVPTYTEQELDSIDQVVASQQKTIPLNRKVRVEENSNSSFMFFVWVIGLFVMLLIAKIGWLSLEAISYNRFCDEMSNENCTYWKVNPWLHLFTNHFRIKDIVDPFSYSDWIKWTHDRSLYDFSEK